MTCIVGVLHDGAVTIGGDSAGVSGLDLTIRADVKVFRNGDALFGFTSSFRAGAILRYLFSPPAPQVGKETMAYLVGPWTAALRACLKEHGYARKYDTGQERGAAFLLGYQGGLYVIDEDFQIGIPMDGYAAVGCGERYALGALFASNDPAFSPTERVTGALLAATHFSGGVCGPYTILTLPAIN